MKQTTKIVLWCVVCIVVVAAALLILRGEEDTWLCENGAWVKHGNPSAPAPATPCPGGAETGTDPRNLSYTIDGMVVVLVNGRAEEEIPGSAAKSVTDVWTVSPNGDLDGVGGEDAAVILTRNTGGSGTFFYLAAAVAEGNGYRGTNALLIGDRIAPQNVSVESGQVIVNYADRNPGESFTVRPSLGVSLYAFLENGRLLVGGPRSRENLIRVAAPLANAVITSPLAISGEARGPWYFEASFPVELLDGAGRSIAVHYATAQGEWMTENMVPFTSSLSFTAPATDTGTLILKRDNPSGLPENDNEVRIPVRFR
jgi:hypothetical protein